MAELTDTNDAVWRSDAGVARFVATAEEREQRRADARLIMAELLPFGEDDAFVFADLGAGTGAAAGSLLDRYRGARAVLCEFSPQMTEQGRRLLARHAGRFEYVEHDLREESWPGSVPGRLDAVISSLSVHHLPDERKRSLFSEVLARLVPGGWYLNFDAVSTDDELVAEAWRRATHREDPAAAERHSHPTPEERLREENHRRYMIPLAPQLGFLADAGFEGIDVYYKRLDFVVYGGRRPLAG